MSPVAEQEFKIQCELVRIQLNNARVGGLGSIVAVFLTTALLWTHVAHNILILWGASFYIFIFIRLAVVKYYLLARFFERPMYCGSINALFAGLIGSFWSILGIATVTLSDSFVTVMICIMVVGTLSSGVTAFSSFFPSYIALATTGSIPLAIHFFLLGGELGPALGFLLLFLMVINLLYCAGSYKTIRQSVFLRFENSSLIRQITEEKNHAEVANRAKSQFLAAASHDLRQPTHALGLFIATLQALLKRQELKRGELENVADRLQVSLGNLAQLLNALLEVSRLDAGVVEVDIRPIALRDTFDSLGNEFLGLAKSSGANLTIKPTALWVKSDPLILYRVLANFLSNAIRYTGKGRILVVCRRRQNFAEIQVWDNGIGIEQDHLPRIFEEFYQAHNASRNREQGLGLGLSIVQRLVNLLGAEIIVRSIVGKGSMFSVRIPIASPVHLQNTLEPRVKLTEVHKTVLVIDDNAEVLAAVKHLVSEWGHTVISASTKEQAVAVAEAHSRPIDLILADYRLAANVTGADAISAVNSALGSTLPAAIVTGDTSPDRIREAGASGYRLLHKPLDPDALRHLLNTC